jgi:histone acetyltransferase 1
VCRLIEDNSSSTSKLIHLFAFHWRAFALGSARDQIKLASKRASSRQPAAQLSLRRRANNLTPAIVCNMDADELEEQIKAQVEEWSSNSNDCLTVNLVRGDGSTAATFQPEFTYPIFGDEEAIFGYQDLEINLSFAAHNLQPHLAVSYSKKFPAKGEVKPTDIHEALRDFLPATAFSNEVVKNALKDSEAANFLPPGEKVHTYTRPGQRFEIWCANLSDPAAKELLENMQVLVPMFIEGGTMLQLEQDWTTQRWKLFLLYSLHPKPNAGQSYSQYSLVGYGTSYRIFTFPERADTAQVTAFASLDHSLDDVLRAQTSNESTPSDASNGVLSPLDLPSRERLSQFLILEQFQKEGHGQELYNTMFKVLTESNNIREFTVEDPNEAFDDLRDLCDLLHLRANDPEFAALRINTDVPEHALGRESELPTDIIVPFKARNAIMKRTKMMQRQFDRLVEMHTLSFIPGLNRSRNRITKRENASNENDKAYYFWRLYVKQRLYIFNRDQLAQLERQERIEKLESALDAVQEAYSQMIEKVQKREESAGLDGEGGSQAVGGARSTPKKKRKVIEDDEDEDMVDEVTAINGNGSKKARVD